MKYRAYMTATGAVGNIYILNSVGKIKSPVTSEEVVNMSVKEDIIVLTTIGRDVTTDVLMSGMKEKLKKVKNSVRYRDLTIKFIRDFRRLG